MWTKPSAKKLSQPVEEELFIRRNHWCFGQSFPISEPGGRVSPLEISRQQVFPLNSQLSAPAPENISSTEIFSPAWAVNRESPLPLITEFCR